MGQQQPLPKNKILMGPPILRFQESELPNIFFTSDIHHQHKNILHFTPRGGDFTDVDDMDSKILETLNNPDLSDIPGADPDKLILFHCGDIQFGSSGQSQKNYSDIQKGLDKYSRVYAVIGNHDRNNVMYQHNLVASYTAGISPDLECNPKWFWNNCYIVEVYRGAQCIMVFTVSHFPMPEFWGSFNIHGHLHSHADVDKESSQYKNWSRWLSTGVHFDCGVDNNQYKPVSMVDILRSKTSIRIESISQVSNIRFKFLENERAQAAAETTETK